MGGQPRILVTGAGGFVGPWLVHALGAQAEILPTYRDAADLKDGHGAVLDLRDDAAIDALVQKFAPTAIVHLAGLSAVPQVKADPDLAWDVNVKATGRLGAAALRHAPKARFIFVSSGEVYGGAPATGAEAIDEAAPLSPRNLYAVTKAAADMLVGQMASEGLNAIRLRPFNHTGPGQTPNFVVPAFAKQIAEIEAGLREPVISVGNLQSQRDFCDVRDIARAYAELALGEGPLPCPVANLASGQLRSIASVLEDLLQLSTSSISILSTANLIRSSDRLEFNISTRVPNSQRIFHPTIPWNTTILETLIYYRNIVTPSS